MTATVNLRLIVGCAGVSQTGSRDVSAPVERSARRHPRAGARAAASRSTIRRRRLIALVVLLLLVAVAVAWAERTGPLAAGQRASGALVLRLDRRVLARMRVRQRDRQAGGPGIQQRVVAVLTPTVTIRRGRAQILFRIDRARTGADAARLGVTGGTIAVDATPIAATIAAPVIAQRLHNDCEAAALQVLLATVGVSVNQQRLLAELPRSGPLDPKGTPPDEIWGDPDLGFVGRPAGGGPAGGFGVYQRPIARLASRHGERLTDLTGQRPPTVYARLLAGHAVMAWVGLGSGPFGSWRTPAGRPVRVNFNEHTVVLTGILPDGRLAVVNPLRGTREIWTQQQFESMWALLGRRALAT